MAKNNFQAKEVATGNYAGNVGDIGQGLASTGAAQQAQGFQNLGESYGAQKNFAQMLQSAAAGTGGPTLAEQQLKDATARNNANAAGFAAGAKGLSPALAARQALLAQAGNNQQAAGQAVQTREQEQLNARAQLGNALAGQAGTAGGMASAGLGAAGTGGALANTSNANLISSRQGANQINADVAKQNASSINNAFGSVLNAAGGAAGMFLAEGGEVPEDSDEEVDNEEDDMAPDEDDFPMMAKGGTVGLERSAPQPHRSFAAQVAHHLSREYFAEGGMAEQPAASDHVPTDKEVREEGDLNEKRRLEMKRQAAVDAGYKDPTDKSTERRMAGGGEVTKEWGLDVSKSPKERIDEEDATQAEANLEKAAHQPKEKHGLDVSGKVPHPYVKKMADGGQAAPMPAFTPSSDDMGGASLLAGGASFGKGLGKLLKPKPNVTAADQAPALGDMMGGAQYTAEGGDIAGKVPGKAAVDGNSLKNDKVHAMLSPGEVVLPRTISHDPPKAKRFVEHLMKNGGSGHKALKDIKKRK